MVVLKNIQTFAPSNYVLDLMRLICDRDESVNARIQTVKRRLYQVTAIYNMRSDKLEPMGKKPYTHTQFFELGHVRVLDFI